MDAKLLKYYLLKAIDEMDSIGTDDAKACADIIRKRFAEELKADDLFVEGVSTWTMG